MPIVDTTTLDAGASIHGHAHPEEEVWHIIEGTLEITLGEDAHVVGPGSAAIVPSNTHHAVRAITNARVIIASHPVRQRVGGRHNR